MKFIGHPIFNDATYGGNEPLKGMVFSKYKQFVDNCFKIIPRQALHAKTLGFIHPGTNKFIQLTSSDYKVAALTIFGELIGNVFDHSQTNLKGFAGLQKYKGRIEAVVSDSGLGIAQTLRPALRNNYPSLHKLYGEGSPEADIGLVKTVMEQGGISRFGGARGLGFKRGPALAGKFNARFSVRQERFGLDFAFKGGELVDVKEHLGLSKLLGTHICFDFYLD